MHEVEERERVIVGEGKRKKEKERDDEINARKIIFDNYIIRVYTTESTFKIFT